MAVLSASVPPEVKNISAGEVFNKLAIVLRAFSTTERTSRPCACIDDGLPNWFSITLHISFITSLSRGVVAALSK